MEHKHNTESHQRSSFERSNAELGDMNEQPISINIEKINLKDCRFFIRMYSMRSVNEQECVVELLDRDINMKL